MSLIDEDEEKNGRILSDDELIAALKNRPDVFLIQQGRSFRNILALVLAGAIIAGAWLRSLPPQKTDSNFYLSLVKLRSAKLLDGRELSGTLQKSPQEESGDAKRNLGASIFDLKKYSEKSPALGPKPPGVRTPRSVKERMALAGFKPDAFSLQNADSILVNQGNVLKKKDHAAAFAAFGRVLKHDPHNSGALAGMGDLFLYTGLLDSAVSFYNAALAVNPRSAATHNGLGSARYYLSAMAANPNFAARNNIADPKHYIKSQYDSAISEYTAAIALDSSNVDALTNRGVIRDINNDYEGAITDYTLALKTNPSWADAYTKRAATFKTLHKYRQAISDYTAAIKLDSLSYDFNPTLRFANAYFGRGVVYHKMGDLAMALADFDTTLALSPTHTLAILNKAITMEDAKQYDSAIAGLTQAIALISPLEYDGVQKLAYLQRGNAFKALGKCDQAIADYTSALESPKLAARACWRMVECYCLRHDNETALVWLKKAVSCGFKDFKAWKRDNDLAPLWNDREFLELIAG
ncbi:MAG: tetratricopeptide repeat protein [Chitinivibrionales bacterium]|nr:tetratricopeptide repeat protein [Chitinivibrionales bacterium]